MLKIDRSFINGLGSSHDDTIIVRSVIAMAHSLGLAALAEGVETLEQLAHLRELGCDEFQGFLAARPMPYESVNPEQSARLAASGATLPTLPQVAGRRPDQGCAGHEARASA